MTTIAWIILSTLIVMVAGVATVLFVALGAINQLDIRIKRLERDEHQRQRVRWGKAGRP